MVVYEFYKKIRMYVDKIEHMTRLRPNGSVDCWRSKRGVKVENIDDYDSDRSDSKDEL